MSAERDGEQDLAAAVGMRPTEIDHCGEHYTVFRYVGTHLWAAIVFDDPAIEMMFAASTLRHWIARAQAAEARVKVLEENLSRERDAWMETANQQARNAQYYRGLVVKIGQMLGQSAYTSDDGSVQDVLCDKVPELVEASLSQSP